jgi:hypothetical protein
MANSGSKKTEEHDHLFQVPEPLEKLFSDLGELEKVGGGEAREDVARIRTLLRSALAAQARGEVGEAVMGITQAMQAIAALAARVDPSEGEEMNAVTRQFARALVRGDGAEASGAADRMRARAGAKVVKRE